MNLLGGPDDRIIRSNAADMLCMATARRAAVQ
jgi:hypothetical protein